mmetsp:Transcript_91109/g.199564  ORF Transcript_91109/g.199564 Transcript_91109/m.199564 type:complete len:218 (-) Transcript_91109:951-1604(-)
MSKQCNLARASSAPSQKPWDPCLNACKPLDKLPEKRRKPTTSSRKCLERIPLRRLTACSRIHLQRGSIPFFPRSATAPNKREDNRSRNSSMDLGVKRTNISLVRPHQRRQRWFLGLRACSAALRTPLLRSNTSRPRRAANPRCKECLLATLSHQGTTLSRPCHLGAAWVRASPCQQVTLPRRNASGLGAWLPMESHFGALHRLGTGWWMYEVLAMEM